MDVMPQRKASGGIQRTLIRNFLTWLDSESEYRLADGDGEALSPMAHLSPDDLDEIVDEYFLSL